MKRFMRIVSALLIFASLLVTLQWIPNPALAQVARPSPAAPSPNPAPTPVAALPPNIIVNTSAPAPDSAWSIAVNLCTALFGVLSAVFAIIAVCVAFRGIGQLKDMFERVEQHANEKVEKRVAEVMDEQLIAKINSALESIAEQEVKKAEERIKAEIQRVIEQSDFRKELIDHVTAELRRTTSETPNSPEESAAKGVKADEFNK